MQQAANGMLPIAKPTGNATGALKLSGCIPSGSSLLPAGIVKAPEVSALKLKATRWQQQREGGVVGSSNGSSGARAVAQHGSSSQADAHACVKQLMTARLVKVSAILEDFRPKLTETTAAINAFKPVSRAHV
jgi:hypothetical protein